ncbi:MAG: hypothetical protein ACYC8S_03030 [Minisyncoccota bacterium]
MSDIQFNTDEQGVQSSIENSFPKDSPMIRLIKRLSGGTVKTTEQANYVLLAIALLFFAGTVIILMKQFNIGPARPLPSSSQNLPPEILKKISPQNQN